MGVKVWTVKLPSGIYDAVKEVAQKLDTTQSQIVKEAVEWFLDKCSNDGLYRAALPSRARRLIRLLEELENKEGGRSFPLTLSAEKKKELDSYAVALGIKKRELVFMVLHDYLEQRHGIKLTPFKN